MSKSLEPAISFPGRMPLKDPKREAFCREYTRHGDKQRAVVAAGYNCKTWKEGSTSASAFACQIMKETKVLERIQYLQEKRARAADLDEINVLKELKSIAFFDIGELYHPNGALKPVNDWPKGARKAVQSIDVEKLFSERQQVGVTVKIKTHAKVAALERLMEYHHMIEKPTVQSVTNIENQQVNFYLPENPRHAKIVGVESAPADAQPQHTNGHHGIALPPKDSGSY